MMRKVAIFDNEDALRFLENARSITDQVRTFLMLGFGMHPENLRRLNKKNITLAESSAMLEFKRAKNDRNRSEMLKSHQAKVILKIIKRGGLNISNRAYELICAEQGKILTNYVTPPISPLTLRHTYILNLLRRFNFDMDLVSVKAGCKVSTVIQNYVDLEDWEKIHKERFREPLDLTDFEFIEG